MVASSNHDCVSNVPVVQVFSGIRRQSKLKTEIKPPPIKLHSVAAVENKPYLKTTTLLYNLLAEKRLILEVLVKFSFLSRTINIILNYTLYWFKQPGCYPPNQT